MKTLLVSVMVVVVGILAFLGGGVLANTGGLSIDPPLEVHTESSNEQIVTAVERQEQIVLVSMNTQGLSEERANSKFLGRNMFGTGRTQFLQYAYRAKLGIEGSEVTIKETEDNQFLVSVPEFIFIGHDKVDFRTAVETNGVLSWATPEIDTAATITRILDDAAKAEQVNENRDLLQEQARNFYTSIINGIDDQVEVDFEFRGGEQ